MVNLPPVMAATRRQIRSELPNTISKDFGQLVAMRQRIAGSAVLTRGVVSSGGCGRGLQAPNVAVPAVAIAPVTGDTGGDGPDAERLRRGLERRLLDGWDKNMALYPVEDWPYFARRRQRVRRHPGKSPQAVRSVAPLVRREIEARGPLSSRELDFGRTVDWSWAPTRLARAALDSMYGWGELIVHHREHTRKYYDFTWRHLDPDLIAAPDPNPTLEAYHDWYVLRRVGGVGLLWNR